MLVRYQLPTYEATGVYTLNLLAKITLGDDFTTAVVQTIGSKADPRVRAIFSNLIHHLHDFTRKSEITVSEWMQGVDMMNRAGQMSNDRENEGQLVCDVLGLES